MKSLKSVMNIGAARRKPGYDQGEHETDMNELIAAMVGTFSG